MSQAAEDVVFNEHIMCTYVFPKLSRKDKRAVSLVCKRWKEMWHWKWWIPERIQQWEKRFESWICWDIIHNDARYLKWIHEESDDEYEKSDDAYEE